MDYAVGLTTCSYTHTHHVLQFSVVMNIPSLPNNNELTGHAEHWRTIAITELAIVIRCRYKFNDNKIGLHNVVTLQFI